MTTAEPLMDLLDVIAHTLDDETPAPALAAHMHLSRSQADRVAKAAWGETPHALRQRLLLERAACALLRTDATVIDIGIQAGFASHEAFTRAFVRAYDAPPSRWRISPRTIPGEVRTFELPTPNGVHFQPPCGLRIPQNRKVNMMDMLVKMMEFHVDTIDALLARLTQVDEERLDRPLNGDIEWVDDQPYSLRLLADGLVSEAERHMMGVQGLDYTPPTDRTVAGLIARQAAAGPWLTSFVADTVAADRLGDAYVELDCPDEERTFGGTILHLITFGAVRRTAALRAYAAATGDESLGWGDPAHLFDAAQR